MRIHVCLCIFFAGFFVFLNASLAMNCDFTRFDPASYVFDSAKIEFLDLEGASTGEIICNAYSLNYEITQNSFVLRKGEIFCDNLSLRTRTAEIFRENSETFYYDYKSEKVPLDVSCSDSELQFRHSHGGTWIDPWPGGNYQWTFQVTESKWTMQLLRFYETSQVLTTLELRKDKF